MYFPPSLLYCIFLHNLKGCLSPPQSIYFLLNCHPQVSTGTFVVPNPLPQ